MLSASLMSAALIFIAELGDKSQLVALWFSTRYRWPTVLAAVTAATLFVHLGAVWMGRTIDGLIPERALAIIVGLSFFGFAAWSVRGDSIQEVDLRERPVPLLGSFGVVALAFFLAELGDKTQLATVSLAGHDPSFVGVWLGSTVGMVAADAVAIAIGLTLGRHLPHRAIGRAAAVLFVVFGAGIIVRAFM